MRRQTLYINLLLFIPGFFFMSSAEYNIDDVVSYAQKYWETPNHECGDYIDCTPGHTGEHPTAVMHHMAGLCKLRFAMHS